MSPIGPISPQETSDADAALEKRLAEPLLKGNKGIDTAQVWIAAFLIVVVGFAAYSNVFGIPFHVEDQRIVRDNTALHSFLTFPASLSPESPAPLTMLTFALNWWIAPGNAAFFHAINLILHLANGVLVFLLCRRLLGPSVPEAVAMLSGMIFVVHPLATESVDYIVGRAGLLATFFILAALLLFLRATRDPDETSIQALAASVFLFILAWAADHSALITPLLILLLDRTQHDSRAMRKRLPIHAPYWAVLIALLAFQTTLGTPSTSSASAAIPLIKIIVPYGLSVAHTAAAQGATAFVALLVVAILGAALMLLRPIAGFGVLWLTLGLYFGSIGSAGLSERSAYMALPGLAILLPWAFSLLKIPPLRVAAGLAAAMLILAAAYTTHLRNTVWQDPVTLWADAVDKAPGSPEARENLGNALLTVASILQDPQAARNYAVQAEEYLREASNMTPGKPDIALSLGLALSYQKRGDEAIGQWLKTLRLNPKSRPAALYLALLFDEKANATRNAEDRIRSLDYFKRADHLEPLSGAPLDRYGQALLVAGDLETAEPILARAVQGDESSPLVPALKYVQDTLKQIRALTQAAAADPTNPTPWLRLCDRAIENNDMAAAAQCLNEAESRGADPAEIAARRSCLSPASPTPDALSTP